MGQIATFMETLHLSYEQVLDGIPYRNLLIMSRDKLRVATGDVVREMNAEQEAAFFAKNGSK